MHLIMPCVNCWILLHYQTEGIGELVIFYDDNVYGARIKVSRDDDGSLMCDHVIAVQTTLRVDETKATWMAIDTSDPNNAARKTFCATFASSPAAQEFEDIFAEVSTFTLQIIGSYRFLMADGFYC